MTISVIFEASPSPMTMNRMGSSASGGTIDSTATNGPNIAPMMGSKPMRMPTTRANTAEMASPIRSRVRLAAVSDHSKY